MADTSCAARPVTRSCLCGRYTYIEGQGTLFEPEHPCFLGVIGAVIVDETMNQAMAVDVYAINASFRVHSLTSIISSAVSDGTCTYIAWQCKNSTKSPGWT